MTAVIVYESMFGSTQAVAQAVAEGLADAHIEAQLVEVGALVAAGGGLPEDTTLLLVGGPTHALSMSSADTRAHAADDATAPLVSTGAGVREWLDDVRLPKNLPVATFDTKIDKPIPGSAAKAVAKRLKARGAHQVTASQSFRVHGKTEGLVEGELFEAVHWGKRVGFAFHGPALFGTAEQKLGA
jgi:hypothetical protein